MAKYDYCPAGGMNGIRVSDAELSSLADAIGRQRIHLELPVTAVDVRADKVVVSLANGKIMEADDVILSVPPGTWKRITFTPSFPPQLSPQMAN